MKFQDLPVDQFHVRVKGTRGTSLEDLFERSAGEVPVRNVKVSETEDSFDLALADSWMEVTPVKQTDALRLIRELSIGRAMIARLSNVAADGSAELQIAFFTGAVVEMGDVEIGVDESIERGVNRIAKRKVPDVHSWLEERCSITHMGQSYYFITAGAAIEEAFLAPDEATSGTPNSGATHHADADGVEADQIEESAGDVEAWRLGAPDLKNAFSVTGSDMRFVATTKLLAGGTSVYAATKLTAHHQTSDKTVLLARGALTFLDLTRTGEIRRRAKQQLALLTADESSYLKKWDEFGALEGEILLDTAREFGAIAFTDPQPNRDGTTDVRITEVTEASREALATRQVDALEIVSSLPDYLTNPDFTFSEFTAAVRARTTRRHDATIRVEVVHFDRQTKTLTLNTESMPASGTLVVSMAGSSTQIERREKAREAILQGRSANPQLGLLVEENGQITSLSAPQKIRPLTAFVQGKVFASHPPTIMQERAIAVALNTPDIALIQGPPGTGKTTVIAAILERLNEISAKQGVRSQGQVLLSGSQHDAVKNMIDRISLNGVPVPKYGSRSGPAGDDQNSFEKRLEEWCGQIAHELREKNPQIAELEEETALKDLYGQYLTSPSNKLAATLVSKIADVDGAILGEKLSREAVKLKKRLTTEAVAGEGQGRHLSAAQRIRTRAESFADDGPERADEALVDLDKVLDEAQRAVLGRASRWNTDRGIPPFLDDLARVKRDLLVHLNEPPVFKIEKQNDEVDDIAHRAINRVRSNGQTAMDRRSAALAELLAELVNNPGGMVEAVSEYSYAFSATVQHSGSRVMAKRKGALESDANASVEYEYVIIDEAARVSPRDLMIPMSQGKRIILVGDHRQLPHIIDAEVAKRMEEGGDDTDESEWLKKSMFEYLFSERLKALERADGIARTVTLDKQFRMHPDLGSFVSRNFYEAFDRMERFESVLPSEDFAHHLPGTHNEPAIWLPVPADRGTAKRLGTSWTRQPEVDEIARQLREWIESEQGADLTYGVISFYKAQADLIRKELERQLGAIAADENRIRVGTVDSFQGMEFDVVFLSIVRTVPPSWTPRDQDRARQARSLFGHLCLYNRLNVSMSRQKRLLVAVGDPALVAHELSADFIPGLVDFFRIAGSATDSAITALQSTEGRTGPVPGGGASRTTRTARRGLGRRFGRGRG